MTETYSFNTIYRTTSLLIFLVVSFMMTQAQVSDMGIIPGKTYYWFNNNTKIHNQTNEKPVVDVPPVCGKKRRAAGNDLSFPFGAGVHAFYYNQEYLAEDLMLEADSSGITATGVASIQNSTSSELQLTFRPDVWVFPFLNVYGLAGYSRSETTPDFTVPGITVSIPGLGDWVVDSVVTISDKLVYYGPVYGGGITLSSGYKAFFFFLDYHYTVSYPKDFDGSLESHNLSAKVGVLLGKEQNRIKGAFWLGTMYINNDHYFTGKVKVSDILPGWENILGNEATYSGTVTAKQRWNFVTGGSMMIGKHHIISLEAGYFERSQLSLSYGFRF